VVELSVPAAAQEGGCSGPPQPEQEPNDTPATATLLQVAQSQHLFDYMARSPSAIGVPGDVDYFRVDVQPGSLLSVLVDTAVLPQSPGSTTRDSVVQILAADGVTLLEWDDDDGTGVAAGAVVSEQASAVVGLPVSGTVYIRVSAWSAGDVLAPYVLWVTAKPAGFLPEVEPNGTSATAMVIPEYPILANIGSIDEDWYRRTFLGGGFHAILVDGDPERDGTTTDVRIDFEFNPVVINSSVGKGAPPPGAEAAWLGSGSGVVSVFRVRLAAGALGGSYSIRLACIGGDNCQVPVELQSFEVR